MSNNFTWQLNSNFRVLELLSDGSPPHNVHYPELKLIAKDVSIALHTNKINNAFVGIRLRKSSKFIAIVIGYGFYAIKLTHTHNSLLLLPMFNRMHIIKIN